MVPTQTSREVCRAYSTYMQPLVRRGGSAIQPTCNQLCAAAAAPHNLHATTCAPLRRRHTTYMHPLVRRGGGATCTYPCVSKPFICACTNNLTGICNGNAEDASWLSISNGQGLVGGNTSFRCINRNCYGRTVPMAAPTGMHLDSFKSIIDTSPTLPSPLPLPGGGGRRLLTDTL